jgi:hypothetical protein
VSGRYGLSSSGPATPQAPRKARAAFAFQFLLVDMLGSNHGPSQYTKLPIVPATMKMGGCARKWPMLCKRNSSCL